MKILKKYIGLITLIIVCKPFYFAEAAGRINSEKSTVKEVTYEQRLSFKNIECRGVLTPGKPIFVYSLYIHEFQNLETSLIKESIKDIERQYHNFHSSDGIHFLFSKYGEYGALRDCNTVKEMLENTPLLVRVTEKVKITNGSGKRYFCDSKVLRKVVLELNPIWPSFCDNENESDNPRCIHPEFVGATAIFRNYNRKEIARDNKLGVNCDDEEILSKAFKMKDYIK